MTNRKKYIQAFGCFLFLAISGALSAQTEPKKQEKINLNTVNNGQTTRPREFPSTYDSLKYPIDSVTYPKGYYKVPKDMSGKDSNKVGSMPR
ncbi:MAG TPA: hypothetical protein VFM99_01705 [Chitinophagales bacterium]|nr:hypothetical protein [Chitinophagales bacterium]